MPFLCYSRRRTSKSTKQTPQRTIHQNINQWINQQYTSNLNSNWVNNMYTLTLNLQVICTFHVFPFSQHQMEEVYIKKYIYPPHFNRSFLFGCRMKEGFRRSSNCDEYDAYDVNSFIFIQINKKERNVFIRNCFKTPSKISKRQILDKICKKYDIYMVLFAF